MKKKGYKVIPQMFDVRPVDQSGVFDVEKACKIEKILRITRPKKDKKVAPTIIHPKTKISPSRANYGRVAPLRAKSFQLGKPVDNQKRVPSLIKFQYRPIKKIEFRDIAHKREASLESFFGPKPERKSVETRKEFSLKSSWPNKNVFPVEVSCPVEVKEGERATAEHFWEEISKINTIRTSWNELKKDRNAETKEKISKSRKNKKQPIFNHFFSNYKKIISNAERKFNQAMLKPALSFVSMLLFVFSLVFGGVLVSRGVGLKDRIMVKGQSAIGYVAQAQEDLKKQDFVSAKGKMENAQVEFEEAEREITMLGGDVLNIFSNLPYVSKISSGKNVIESGKLLVRAGAEIAQAAEIFSKIDNPFGQEENSNSLTDILLSANGYIFSANKGLMEAERSLEKINPSDLPVQYQEKLEKIKLAVPVAVKTISGFEQNYQIFLDILGHNGPRKYLFLFQNNQEMRATGGFIGSYGIMDINDGHIKNIFIDGIYNPDGQLRERVVPPQPIQKISAAWTTHDANWFPNFPTTAEKVAWFYEKTGGPTVDGVITLTPTVLQEMLQITGPIEMSEYETTVDKDNFIEKTQYEVEIDYDKDQNKPKQFIADLAPKILDKVFSSKDPQQVSALVKVLSRALREKQILIYSYDYNLQKLISDQGWSGEILQTSKDYLMVINSNINGYKTDGIIDEQISHLAEIQPDGSIIDTVKVKRVHNGGHSQFEWWNKVNSDYMRVYVPKGSRLLEANGQTREFNQPPIDYDQLGFRHDPNVQREELDMEVDEQSGTRVYEEENKTVFANWVYVSPGETVELEYKYVLPFKVDFNKNSDHSESYSLLAQKQSGSIGSGFFSQLNLPENGKVIWKYPEGVEIEENTARFSGKLSQDRFYGLVFQKK